MKEFEAEHKVRYLGYFDGYVQYIPLSVTIAVMTEIVEMLQNPSQNSDKIKNAIYELWLTTKHEKLSEDDRTNLLAIYFTKLKMYPPQSVAFVLRDFSDTSHFFPSWAEIKVVLDKHSGWRNQLIRCLRAVATQNKPK
jgi:hypothetical protein